jgi:DNA-binding ferritin-like protein
MENLTLSQMAYISFMWRNDMHFLHHHISGLWFDSLHAKANEYYEKALEDFDYFCEKAISHNEPIINVSDIGETDVYPAWNILHSEDSLTADDFVEQLATNGFDYIDALKMCRENYPEDTEIQSDIDSFLSYWTGEINYKNLQRSE